MAPLLVWHCHSDIKRILFSSTTANLLKDRKGAEREVSERMALAFEQREYCLPQLDALANGMATVLEHRGVRPGDRVALMSSNRPEFVIALWAIWRLGASAVLLSPAWNRGRECAGADHAVARGWRRSSARRSDADAVLG
jgi:acyl-CoA synthetase (AMP-forming)/AMP-acid ligase II